MLHKPGRSVFTHISPLFLLGWSALAYLRNPWAEVAPFPCQHPLTLVKCQERNSTYANTPGAWGDKEPMHHWAEGGEQFQCVSQGFWGDNLPMQSCDFPLDLFGCDTEHQKQQERLASSYRPQTLLTPCLKGLRALLVLWPFLVSSAVKDLDVTHLSHSPSHWVFKQWLLQNNSELLGGFSMHHCTTVITRAFISKGSHGRNFEGLRDFHLEISFLGTQQFCCLVRHTVQTALQKILVAKVLQD